MTARGAPACPECGCACSRCGPARVPPWLAGRRAKLRSRDILARLAGTPEARLTSRQVSRTFKVTIWDASKRLRVLERSGTLRRVGRRGRAIIYGPTDYGLAKAREYGRGAGGAKGR